MENNNQSLTESLKLKTLDWETDLNTLIKDFNQELFEKVEEAATEWTTCPCGNLQINLPRYPEGYAPRDYSLRELGCAFGIKVALKDFGEALLLLSDIKDRAKDILTKLE
jgi:hypothetical protein